MSDWEDEADEILGDIAIAGDDGNWDDEDGSDMEEEPKAALQAATAASSAAPVKTSEKKLSKKEKKALEKERRKLERQAQKNAAVGARRSAPGGEDDEMAAVAEKLNKQRLVEEADMENAADLLGAAPAAAAGTVDPLAVIDAAFEKLDLGSDDALTAVGQRIADVLGAKISSEEMGLLLVATLEAAKENKSLEAPELQDLSSKANVLRNDLLKAAKAQSGKKKKKKGKAINMGRSAVDEYDDFF